MIGLACVLAVITITLLATPPKPEPVKVWFVRATNEAGVRKLVFEGTNGTVGMIQVDACVVTGAVRQVKIPTDSVVFYDTHDAVVTGGGSFKFILLAPQGDVPYSVRWDFYTLERPGTLLGKLRWDCYDFLFVHGMPRLAQLFSSKAATHYIPSSEIRNKPLSN